MKRTKIVCTIGPASDNKKTLSELIDAGMNVARLNFSHGSHEEHVAKMNLIRELSKEKGVSVAILLDTKGPEIRTGIIKDDKKVVLEEGQDFILTTEDIEGDKNRVSVSYKDLTNDISIANEILIDDGLIGLQVKEVSKTEIICEVVNGGELGSRKGVNLPGISVNLPPITEKDVADIEFGIEQGVDFIAASFVRKVDDILAIREILEEHNSDIHVLPKIENHEGVENIDEILEVSDGLMVARGDLGVEIPPERVPTVQKMMIKKCNNAGKPVITATQMLDSMMSNPRPTRAEASDVANAIYDGTDAIMLSGETAVGKYPVEAVKTMTRIAVETEKSLQDERNLDDIVTKRSITNAIGYSTCKTAHDLNATSIITSTRSGYTARMVARYRPQCQVVAATPSERTLKKLLLVWGVIPVKSQVTDSTDGMIEVSVKAAEDEGYVESGNLVVITAGAAGGIPGTTNLIKVHMVGKEVLRGVGLGHYSVIGRVCVAKNAHEANKGIEKGDILVTKETSKDYLPAIQKASTVITEQAGLTSHAAIAGLKSGIPVIVGVTDVTEFVETGETITADSLRGLIYKGKVNII